MRVNANLKGRGSCQLLVLVLEVPVQQHESIIQTLKLTCHVERYPVLDETSKAICMFVFTRRKGCRRLQTKQQQCSPIRVLEVREHQLDAGLTLKLLDILRQTRCGLQVVVQALDDCDGDRRACVVVELAIIYASSIVESRRKTRYLNLPEFRIGKGRSNVA